MSPFGSCLSAVACLTLAACSTGEEPQAANNAVVAQAPAISPLDTSPPPRVPGDENGYLPLTAEGWGPLKIGMTLAEIIEKMGPDSDPEAVGGPDPESCDQFRPARAPEGMLVMVEDGRLTSISLIRQAKVKTDRGLGLGATAADVRATYGKLEVTPHKYVEAPAEYLTAWAKGGGPTDAPAPPGSRGIQYEVNASGNVGAIHAGGPSILYVEGCA
ncbi:MAG: hypothetical protein H0W39_01835 [Sphingomonas sp.]|nr:hypothetical protein [Sphingomonas sp.]